LESALIVSPFGRSCPDEAFRILIVSVHIVVDGGDQIHDVAKRTTAEAVGQRSQATHRNFVRRDAQLLSDLLVLFSGSRKEPMRARSTKRTDRDHARAHCQSFLLFGIQHNRGSHAPGGRTSLL
jgi:hypothetical protein